LFSWAMQAPLALDLIRLTLLILIQQVETDINKLSSLALIDLNSWIRSKIS
jgi:hypothetical protein